MDTQPITETIPVVAPPTTPPEIVLTEEQQTAVNTVKAWATNPLASPDFKLGGYAGTGKTTVIKVIRKTFSDLKIRTKLCAFTGKAVNVLQRKQLYDAQTMHSMMYDVLEAKPGEPPIFERKFTLLDNPKVVIVDESSMVSRELLDDLMSFKKLVLFVGDPGQLEPVGDNPNLMANPDLVLQTIHRQAAQSPIIMLASHVRMGGSLSLKGDISDPLCIRSKKGFNLDLAASYDQVICAKNKTRREVNSLFRQFLSRPAEGLVEGDKIIVLRNNRSFGVFNGMILFITEIKQDHSLFWKVNAKDEVGQLYYGLKIWKEPFTRNFDSDNLSIPRDGKDQLVYADFGYCITCHKSQGSEWDKVLVWDEWMPPKIWDMKRWRYTAITRAAKQLTYCV